jgi:hypothetical protein
VTPVGFFFGLFAEAPRFRSDAAKERPLPALVSTASGSVRRGHKVKSVFPIGILLYLASIGVVAIATVGVLFGIGFFLLVQPTDGFEARAAAHRQGASLGSLFFSDTEAADTKVVTVHIKPEPPRAVAPAALAPAPVAQPPAVDQIPSPEQTGAALPSPVPAVPGSEAKAPVEEEAKQAEGGVATGAVVSVVVAGDPPSSTTIPAATTAPPSPATVDVAELLARGDGHLGMGDITSARLFYERAADAGSGQAAMRLGATFDPKFLGRAGLVGTRGDQATADMWYRRGLGTATTASEARSRETK